MPPDLNAERQRLTELFDIAPSRVLYAMCALNVADHIPAAGISLVELAAQLGLDIARLNRLVLAAQSLRVCHVDEHDMVRLTPAGSLLRADRDDSLWAEFADNSLFGHWSSFAETIRDGRSSYELHHGHSLFGHLSSSHTRLSAFHSHMHQRAAQLYRPLVPYLLSRCTTSVLDVAGGTGGLAELLLSHSPTIKVTVMDRPEVISLIPPHPRHPHNGRLATLSGDITQRLPGGFDTYVLSSVLHDWPDDAAAEILRNCRTAALNGGEIIILERVLADRGPDPRRMGDMWMLAMTGGRERTRAQWSALADAADLTLHQVHHVNTSEISALTLVPLPDC